MTPLTWLRSRRTPPKRPEFATGGLVPAPQHDDPPLLPTGCTMPLPTRHDPPDDLQIAIRDFSSHLLTRYDLNAISDALLPLVFAHAAEVAAHAPHEPGLFDTPLDAWTMCPCFAVYSRCYCPVRT